jgi:hypothetical protein
MDWKTWQNVNSQEPPPAKPRAWLATNRQLLPFKNSLNDQPSKLASFRGSLCFNFQ